MSFTWDVPDRFNFAPYQYILTPNERYGGWASAKTALTDTINLRVRGLYNRRLTNYRRWWRGNRWNGDRRWR